MVDPSAEAAQAVSAGTGAQAAALDAVLADPGVDGVIIASSTDTHLDYCLRVAATGRAIFCEKPMGTDPVNVRKFMAAAKKSVDLKLTVKSGRGRRIVRR